MKKVLLTSLAVAALALPASAHRITHDTAVNFYANMSTLNAGGVWLDKDNSSAAWSIQSAPAGNVVTLPYEGIDYPAFEYTGENPVTLTIRHARSSSPISKETDIPNGVLPWDTQIQYEILVKRAADNTNASAIAPSFKITKTKFKNTWSYNEDSDAMEWSGSQTVNIEYKPTDGKTEVPVDGNTTYVFSADKISKNGQKSGAYPCTEDYYMFRSSVYTRYDIILTNIEKGDIVTVIRVDRGRAILNNENIENGWVFPTLDYDKQVQKNVRHDGANSSGANSRTPLEVGEIWIQAEDFDEPWINNRVAVSATKTTEAWNDAYGYYGRQKAFDSLDGNEEHAQGLNSRIAQNSQFAAEIGGCSNWDAQHGFYVTPNSNHDWAFSYFAQKEWNEPYKDASEEASLDDLAEYYGAWAEYTFVAKEEMYADFSIRAGIATANYNAYRATPAGEGNPSPTVAGEGVNYINRYGGTYRIFVDGEPIPSAWEIRPPVQINSREDYLNLDNWERLVNEDARSVENTSYVAQMIPAEYTLRGAGRPWNSNTKKEFLDECKINGLSSLIDDEKYALLSKPDFCDVHLTKGKHTLKVQAMGGQSAFDAVVVNAHKDSKWTPTGIEAIGADNQGMVDENAPVEFYNLQGVRVENPSNGIFIRRQGSKVTKVAIR